MPGPRCRHCGGSRWVEEGKPDDIGRCAECAEFLTLGPRVVAWMEDACVIPDRDFRGQPFIPTDEQALFFYQHYRLLPSGKWFYVRGSQLVRPQKYGKGPQAAAWVCAEAAGDVIFDGWDASGQPVGRPWATPHIQVTACSEDQTDNTWRALQPMIELGPLGEQFIPDTGLTRINLPGGGLIEPVTASARSRLGQRITAAVQDQTESWVQSNNGWMLADNQRRGLAGMGGRFLETCNAPDPVENSVAFRTPNEPGVYVDDVDGGAGSVRNKVERRKVLKKVYGDSTVERGGWIDLDRIDAEIEALLEHDPGQAERFFLNRKIASEGAAFNFEQFKTLQKTRKPEKHAVITIGVDGARRRDALAMIATEVRSGFQWSLGIWERPDKASDDYEHPPHEVDGAMLGAFEGFNVWRVYIDDQWIDHLVELWANRWGDKRVKAWHTNRNEQIGKAVREYEQAVSAGDVSHDGNPQFVEHIRNARRRALPVKDDQERFMHTLAKDHDRSPRKIDAAMAAVLSWKARGDAIEAGVVVMDEHQPPVPEPSREWVPGTALPAEALTGAGSYGPMGSMS